LFLDLSPDLWGGNQLRQWIAQQITQRPDRRITFAEFMDWALYHPEYGYYNNRARQIGAIGDFFTAPHLGPDFGELLAQQLVAMWQQLGRPRPFQLVEMGAGQGLLAQDILRYLQQHEPDCFANLEYIMVEKAAGLMAQQQRQLQGQFGNRVALSWQTLESLADQPITGCIFSNELVDALAVHRVEFVGGELQEVYVTTLADPQLADPQLVDPQLADPQFGDVLGSASTPRLAEYFDFVGVQPTGTDYPDRYRTEVNLAAIDWLRSVAAGLARGYVITIDYGYPASRYYSRVRSQGTLQCYYQHSHHADPYIHVGEQDITAHVDFTALERQGEQIGLRKIGVTPQMMFLMSLGLGDRLAQLGQSQSTDPQEVMACLRRRDALHQLINPMGMGNFGVLIQAKGLTESELQYLPQGLQAPIVSRLF
jgi:SAM-dependent MidA family methyltransferase